MSEGQRGSGVANHKPMKKLLTITLILFSTLLFSQGTLTENGVTIATIPQYDLSNGNTSWVLNINKLYSYKWLMFFQFENLTGTLDGTLSVYVSGDNGISWVEYPSFIPQTINANKSMSFDDSYTIYDQIKIVLTINNITGGTVNVNQRLISNPKK